MLDLKKDEVQFEKKNKMLCILYKFISLFTPFVHFTLKWHDVDKEVENKKPTSNLLY